MAKLAYCEMCKSTFPLAIVSPTGTRSGKSKALACPLGHTKVREIVKLTKPKRGK